MSNILKYYSEPGEITCIDKYKDFTDWLTDAPNTIIQVVQGLLVHDMWVGLYGEEYIKSHEYPQKTAFMVDLLDKALDLHPGNLAIPRMPRDRVIVCCREFATLMCAFLRAKGIPARSRCGFAAYFGWNGDFEDHWICEYWNGERWIMADPQLDPFQLGTIRQWAVNSVQDKNTLERLKHFNPHDLKPDEFISAGQAWKLCREGTVNPESFGIGCPIRPEWGIDSLHGLWFVRGQLLRDFAALNKVETIPFLVRICKGLDWNPWRLVALKDCELTSEDLLLLDKIADLTIDVDWKHDEILKLYHENKDLEVPAEIIVRYLITQ